MSVKVYAWNEEKNEWLKAERGICFEEVIVHIAAGDLLDIVEHPNPEKYQGQGMFIINFKLEAEERDLLDSYERDEWQSVGGSPERLKQYQAYATAALEAEGLVSIPLPKEDLEAIRQKAIEAGVSYQTLIANILHQFVSGHLVEKPHAA